MQLTYATAASILVRGNQAVPMQVKPTTVCMLVEDLPTYCRIAERLLGHCAGLAR